MWCWFCMIEFVIVFVGLFWRYWWIVFYILFFCFIWNICVVFWFCDIGWRMGYDFCCYEKFSFGYFVNFGLVFGIFGFGWVLGRNRRIFVFIGNLWMFIVFLSICSVFYIFCCLFCEILFFCYFLDFGLVLIVCFFWLCFVLINFFFLFVFIWKILLNSGCFVCCVSRINLLRGG